jgi:hypothetical protein
MDRGTVAGAIEHLGRRGFTDHFMVSGRKLLALDAGKTFLPRDVVIREYADPAVGAMLDILRIERCAGWPSCPGSWGTR